MLILFLLTSLSSYVAAKRFNFESLAIIEDGHLQHHNITREIKTGQQHQNQTRCPSQSFVESPPKENIIAKIPKLWRLWQEGRLFKASAAHKCWTKAHQGTGVTLWIFRAQKEYRGLPRLTPGNYFALNAFPEGLLQEGEAVDVVAYKVRLYTDTMAEYYHSQRLGEKVQLQYRLNSPLATCTDVPHDIATVGVRQEGGPSMQIPQCYQETKHGGACYKDTCMNEAQAQAILQTCVRGGAQMCWFGIPYDMKNVDVLNSKGPFHFAGGRLSSEFWPDPDVLRAIGEEPDASRDIPNSSGH